jgi:small-conductance mechanosensitive channel
MILNFLLKLILFLQKKINIFVLLGFFLIIIIVIYKLVKKYFFSFVKLILSKFSNDLQRWLINILNKYVYFWVFLLVSYIVLLKSNIIPINYNIIINKVFFGMFSFSIVILIAYIVSNFFQERVHERIGSNIIKFTIIFIGLLLVLNQIGIKITPIFTALGVTTVALALSIQDIITNFFAGITILTSKQIMKNDYIKIDTGQEGTVIELNWRTILIKDISNAVIVIPNTKITSGVITNFRYLKSEITGSISCGVAYDSDLDHVEKTAIIAAQEVINKCDDASKKYTPIVRFVKFDDSSINFCLFFKVKNAYAKSFIKSEILKNLKKKFKEEQIKIPFPKRIIKFDD